MKLKTVLYTITAAIILLILLVACSKGPAATSVQNPVTTQQPGVNPPTLVATKAPLTVPADVPVMPNATDLVVPTEFNVTYEVNVPIKDVVDFYQQELPKAGWDQPANPDSVVGAMAQMARTKANGDRITFSIQYNPVGEFTIVQIYLTRAPTPAPS